MKKSDLNKKLSFYDEHSIFFSESKKRIIYPKKVHRYNAESKTYEKFNNSIDIEGELYFVNKNDPYFIRFNRNVNSDELFYMRKNEFGISVLVPMSEKSVTRKRDDENIDCIRFDGVVKGGHILCGVNGGSITSKLMINAPMRNYSFDFILKCENLYCKKNKQSGKILFIDPQTREPIYELMTPTVSDSEIEGGVRVNYEIFEYKDFEYILTVKVDSEWANKYNINFPICVDMHFVPAEEYEFFSCSWVNGSIYHSDKHMVGLFGLGNSLQYYCRMYLKLDFPISLNAFPARKAIIKLKYRKRNPFYDILKVEMHRIDDINNIIQYNFSSSVENIVTGTVIDGYYMFDFTDHYNSMISDGRFKAEYILMDKEEANYMFNALRIMGTDSLSEPPEIIIYY